MLFVKTSLRPSRIHGTGLFADVFIPKGSVIWRFVEGYDSALTRIEFESLDDALREEWERFAYVSRFTGDLIRSGGTYVWMNHSHSPNIDTRVDSHPPHPEGCDFALCDIEKGDELTFDYRWFGEDPCCYHDLGRLPIDLDVILKCGLTTP